MAEVWLPETFTHIGEYTFAYCGNLRKVTVTAEELNYFGEYLFDHVPYITVRFENTKAVNWRENENEPIFYIKENVKIECLRDSDPMQFAEENGISYEIIN